MRKNSPRPIHADFNHKNQHIFDLNIDWFQAHISARADRFSEFETPLFRCDRTGQSKVFRSIYEVRYKKHNRVMCTISADANEEILPTGHAVVKIDNFYLYHFAARFRPFVEWLLRRLDCHFHGITRLDIAYDFNSFNNRREPENFIKAFLRNEIVKLQKTKFDVFAEHDRENRFHAIRFGSKLSIVNYKLYNKSKEMRDEKEKAHIMDSWKRSLLDLTKDVWRLEFSIKANTAVLLNEWGNEKFHDLCTLNLERYAGLFHFLFQKYFDFRHHDRSKCRKDRMKPVNLLSFPPEFPRLNVLKGNPMKKDHSRSTKIFLKKLESHQDEMRGKDDDFVVDARALISKLISVYGLQNWAAKKGIDFDQYQYAEELFDAVLPGEAGQTGSYETLQNAFRLHGFSGTNYTDELTTK